MTLAVGLLGIFVLALGLLGAVQPLRMLDLVGRLQSRSGLYFVGTVRILLGIALWLAAPQSRLPRYLQVLGVVALISGVVTFFFGVERFGALLAWWRARSPGFQRAWCVVAALFGSSLVFAVFPELQAP